jgi:signal transduction histidine kinase
MARSIVQPIRDLTVSAARIGAGALGHRIAVRTGDELGALGTQFNRMASQLQGSYLTLERKVEERTHQLQVANQSKSRFLAAASHDLRQPLHALNLFAAQLLAETDPAERDRLAVQIDAAIASMNDLFNALLDISRLDAGVLQATIVDFPVNTVLDRLDAMFAQAARAKSLRLRVVRSRSWVRSDPILLERILLNLVANAVRYTAAGGIVVGCRRMNAKRLRIEVCDSGIGIPAEHQAHVFDEFYRVTSPEQDRKDGLGLGLAIVARLAALLDHPVSVTSTPGRGSRFGVSVLSVSARAEAPAQTVANPPMRDPLQGKRVVVIDDDPLVLDGTSGLLRSWGCRVVVGASATAILANLDGDIPDLIMSDFHLRDGRTGIDAIAALREACHGLIPALLISGDISRERLHEAQARGHHLLHKPLSPIALRAMMSRLLQADMRA